MKRIILSLAMVGCIPLCAWSAASVPVPQANVSVQDPRVWDFGSAKAGDVAEHTFTLTNDSSKDLVIKDTTTSCGCTVSEIKKKLLKPGESTELLIKFDTKGYSGRSQQFVYVNTDRMEEPIVRFTVTAIVTP